MINTLVQRMRDCDVAVVGAGVIGASIAYELAVRGASVTLLDCRGTGLGATQAAAGMLVPYLEGLGRPLLPLATKSLAMYDAFVERVSRDAGVGVGYCRTGSLQALPPTGRLRAPGHCRRGPRRRPGVRVARRAGRARGGTATDARSVRCAADYVARVCRCR